MLRQATTLSLDDLVSGVLRTPSMWCTEESRFALSDTYMHICGVDVVFCDLYTVCTALVVSCVVVCRKAKFNFHHTQNI